MGERNCGNGNKRNEILSLVLTVLWIAFIFSNSLQDGELSGERSGRLLALINGLLEGSDIRLSEFVLRKMAHFGEFMVLGLFLFFTWKGWARNYGNRYLIAAVGSGFFVACSDECLQLFSEGRAGRLMDVGIDTAGCAVGVLVCMLYMCMKNVKARSGNERP